MCTRLINSGHILHAKERVLGGSCTFPILRGRPNAHKFLGPILFDHRRTATSAPCGLRGSKNKPAPFPGRMSYKATKPGLVFVLYLSML